MQWKKMSQDLSALILPRRGWQKIKQLYQTGSYTAEDIQARWFFPALGLLCLLRFIWQFATAYAQLGQLKNALIMACIQLSYLLMLLLIIFFGSLWGWKLAEKRQSPWVQEPQRTFFLLGSLRGGFLLLLLAVLLNLRLTLWFWLLALLCTWPYLYTGAQQFLLLRQRGAVIVSLSFLFIFCSLAVLGVWFMGAFVL